MLEHQWEMECRCGKRNCRKRVTDFDTLPPGLQKKYLSQNIVQNFIVNFMNGKNLLRLTACNELLDIESQAMVDLEQFHEQ